MTSTLDYCGHVGRYITKLCKTALTFHNDLRIWSAEVENSRSDAGRALGGNGIFSRGCEREKPEDPGYLLLLAAPWTKRGLNTFFSLIANNEGIWICSRQPWQRILSANHHVDFLQKESNTTTKLKIYHIVYKGMTRDVISRHWLLLFLIKVKSSKGKTELIFKSEQNNKQVSSAGYPLNGFGVTDELFHYRTNQICKDTVWGGLTFSYIWHMYRKPRGASLFSWFL